MDTGLARRTTLILLAAILAVGGAVRVLRCHYGVPYPVHWDEPLVVESGLKVIGGGGFEPYTFRYGTPPIYLSAAVSALAFLRDAPTGATASLADWTGRFPTMTDTLSIVTQAPSAWYWTRLLFAALSLFTVWGAYALARALLLCRPAALFAAALISVSPLHVLQSTVATVDALGLASVTWSLVFLLRRYPLDLSPGSVVASAAFAGLAVATKISFLPAAGIVLAGTLSSGGGGSARLRLSLLGAATIAASFLIASPFSLVSLGAYLAGIGAELYHFGFLGHDGYQHDPLAWSVFPRIWQAIGTPGISGWSLLWLVALGAIGGSVAKPRAPARRLLLVLGAAVAWALLLGRQMVFFDRTALPFLPVMAVLAAGGVHLLVAGERSGWPRRVGLTVASVLGLAVVFPVGVAQAGEAVRLWRFVDTRQRLVAYLLEHAVPGQTIAVDRQLPLYLGDLRRHRLIISFVDPVTDPCWFMHEPYDYFATSAEAGPGWPPALWELEGNPSSIGHPVVSPRVHLYPRRPAGPCESAQTPRAAWYPPQGLHSGSGVDMTGFNRGLGYFDLGYDGWMELALQGDVGDHAQVRIDVEGRQVGPRRTDDRPVLVARIVDGTGEDVCWSVLPVGERKETTLSCRLTGQPGWKLQLSFPAAVEWGIRCPWVIRLRTVTASAAAKP